MTFPEILVNVFYFDFHSGCYIVNGIADNCLLVEYYVHKSDSSTNLIIIYQGMNMLIQDNILYIKREVRITINRDSKEMSRQLEIAMYLSHQLAWVTGIQGKWE